MLSPLTKCQIQIDFQIIKLLCPFRYGWTSNASTVILRSSHHENCAKNMTGFIFNSRVAADDRYDAYCFDETGDYIHRMLAVYRLIPRVMLKLM